MGGRPQHRSYIKMAKDDEPVPSGEESTDEDMPDMDDGEVDASGKPKQSRSEKKSRKAMAKLGMKPVPGIIRVTVEQFKAAQPGAEALAEKIEEVNAEGDDEDEDAGDLDETDIELVVKQAGVSKA